MKKLVILLSLLALSALPFSVVAQERGPDIKGPAPAEYQCGRIPQGPGPHFPVPLTLSKEQRNRMAELGRKFMADTHDLRFDILIKRLEMEKLFTNPKIGEAALLEKQKELSLLEQRLTEAEGRKRIEWRRLLTPEQIAQLGSIPPPPPMHQGFGAPGPMMDGDEPSGGKGPGNSPFNRRD